MKNNINTHPETTACYPALIQLIKSCTDYGIKINYIISFFDGFKVTFENCAAMNAVFYSHSKKSEIGYWETNGFPWDIGYSSSLSITALVDRIWAIQHNYKWNYFQDE